MKKLFYLLVIFLLVGCNSVKNNEKNNNITENGSNKNNINSYKESRIETAIKNALIEKIAKDEQQGIWGYENSIWAEGHKTLRTETKGNRIYAYVLATMETLTEENGTYKTTSEMAGPIVIILTRNYTFVDYKMPSDGMEYEESLKNIFPNDLIKQATEVNYQDEFYQNQINAYLK